MATNSIKLDLTWQQGFAGTGEIRGHDFNVPISIPAELGGSGQGSNPKQLLASSAAACFIATLTAILDNRKLPVQQLNVATQADEVEKVLQIRHTANIALAPTASTEQVASLAGLVARADKVCLIGNILRQGGVLIEASLAQ
ncbi:OsmC family protein [Pseudaeromonas sp. ZJS20]|uniref:OsmC family protein n=1 Tax=Pseudaeromonas aegiceratis TaxID=3153928 RepID=UPI00390C9753